MQYWFWNDHTVTAAPKGYLVAEVSWSASSTALTFTLHDDVAARRWSHPGNGDWKGSPQTTSANSGADGTLETKRAHPWSWPFPVPPLLARPSIRHSDIRSSMQRETFSAPVDGQMRPPLANHEMILAERFHHQKRESPFSTCVSFNVQNGNTRVDIINVMLTVHGMCLIFDGYRQGCP